MRRLQYAYEQWTRLAQAEGDDAARAWFIGADPWRGDDTPLTAIREDRFKKTSVAVQAFIDDTFSG